MKGKGTELPEQAAPVRPPQPVAAPRIANKPQCTIGVRHFRVAGRGDGTSMGVGMIMAEDDSRLPHFIPFARAAMGTDQHRRINLEPARGIVRDIGGRQNRRNPVASPEQETTDLPVGAGLRRIENPVEKLS